MRAIGGLREQEMSRRSAISSTVGRIMGHNSDRQRSNDNMNQAFLEISWQEYGFRILTVFNPERPLPLWHCEQFCLDQQQQNPNLRKVLTRLEYCTCM